MAYFSERWETFKEGVGDKRFFLLSAAKVAVVFGGAIIYAVWGREMTLAAQIFLGAAVLFALLFWVMVEYAVKLKVRLKPLLTIEYDDSKPDCHKQVKYKIPPPNSSGQDSYRDGHTLRLRVKCATEANVQNCSGFLTKIEYRAQGGSFSDLPFFEPSYLQWAFENPTPFAPVSVFPRVPRYLVVCTSQDGENGFRAPTRARSFVTPELFSHHGEYRLTVEIVAERSPPVSVVFLITWDGRWNGIKACLAESI